MSRTTFLLYFIYSLLHSVVSENLNQTLNEIPSQDKNFTKRQIFTEGDELYNRNNYFQTEKNYSSEEEVLENNVNFPRINTSFESNTKGRLLQTRRNNYFGEDQPALQSHNHQLHGRVIANSEKLEGTGKNIVGSSAYHSMFHKSFPVAIEKIKGSHIKGNLLEKNKGGMVTSMHSVPVLPEPPNPGLPTFSISGFPIPVIINPSLSYLRPPLPQLPPPSVTIPGPPLQTNFPKINLPPPQNFNPGPPVPKLSTSSQNCFHSCTPNPCHCDKGLVIHFNTQCPPCFEEKSNCEQKFILTPKPQLGTVHASPASFPNESLMTSNPFVSSSFMYTNF